MTDPENLSKLRGIRKSNLRNITNVENKVLQLISNIEPKKNQTLKLLAKKNILLKKIEKVKTIDENIIDLLHEEVMEMELDEYLARNENFHELFVKIDLCLETLENDLRVISLNSVSSNPPKMKIPKLKISKFDGNLTNLQIFRQQFESAIHLKDTFDNINKFN